MSTTSSPIWTVQEAAATSVFLIEFLDKVDGGIPTRRNIIPAPLLATTYAGGSHGKIYLPKPMIYGATCYHGRDRTIFPFALPFPSLLIPSERISIREIPRPACVNWPPFAWPMAAPLLTALSARSLTNSIADASHTPRGFS